MHDRRFLLRLSLPILFAEILETCSIHTFPQPFRSVYCLPDPRNLGVAHRNRRQGSGGT